MKIPKFGNMLRHSLVAIFLVFSVAHCASDGGEEELEDLGEEGAEEGAEGEEYTEEDAAMPESTDGGVENSYAEDISLGDMDATYDDTGVANALPDAGAVGMDDMGTGMADVGTGVTNEAMSDTGATSAVTDIGTDAAGAGFTSAESLASDATVAAVAVPPSATSLPAAMPATGTMVRYAAQDGIQIYDQASQSGAVVSQLSRGDSVLVTIQGEWAQVAGKGYVLTASLSDRPVPRNFVDPGWQ